MDQDHLEFVRMNPEQSFHHVIQHIVERHPQIDAFVHTGDLAQVPVPRTYQRYLDFMQSLKTPFYQVPAIMTMPNTSLFISNKTKST